MSALEKEWNYLSTQTRDLDKDLAKAKADSDRLDMGMKVYNRLQRPRTPFYAY